MMTYGWFPFVYRLILVIARLLVLEKLPPKHVALAKLLQVHCTDLCTCGTKNKSCKNKPVFIFIFDYIYHLPCAFRAISRSSEDYMFYNLHLSVIVRIIKVQPCYQRRLTDQRKRKREFWKIEVIDRSIVVYMVFLSVSCQGISLLKL